jgi:hypothetical protein
LKKKKPSGATATASATGSSKLPPRIKLTNTEKPSSNSPGHESLDDLRLNAPSPYAPAPKH